MKRNNIIVGQGYTIPVCSIVEQIWMDGHPDEEFDQLDPPTWKEGLQRIDDQIDYAVPEIFYFDYPYYGDASDKDHLEKHIGWKSLGKVLCGWVTQPGDIEGKPELQQAYELGKKIE